MICKNCSNSFEDSLPFCPECGERAEANKSEGTNENLNVNTSQGDFEDIFSDSSKQKAFQQAATESVSEETAEEKADISADENTEQAEEVLEEKAEETAEETSDEISEEVSEETTEETPETQGTETETEETTKTEASAQSEHEEPEAEPKDEEVSDKADNNQIQAREIKPRPVRRTAPQQQIRTKQSAKAAPKRMKPARARKETKQEKKAHRVILITSSVMAVLLCVLSVIGLFTDVFKKDDAIKAVGISVLTAQEQQLLENGVSKLYTVLQGKEYEQGTVSAEDILHSLSVGKEGGVFKYLDGKAEYVTENSDPALRYKRNSEEQTETVSPYTTTAETQTGDYEYYTVKKADMSKVLQDLGVKEDLTVNCEHCYLYGDYYYFAPSEDTTSFKQYSVKIKSSKRMQDGGYYAVCTYGSSDEVYVTAYKNQSDEGEILWDIKSVKNEPVFDQLGNIIDYTEDGDISFEMKRTVIEGYLDDGETLFCEYVIEYPFFMGETQGEVNLNTLFASAVANYTSQSESAKKLYKEYKKQGYDVSELPLQVYFRAEVTYNGEDYIGIKSVISESAKIPVEKQEETTSSYSYNYNEPTPESVTLGSKTVEGYTVDLQTGDYVNKDIFVGKDYLDVQEIIYRIYNSYDYSTVLSGDEQYIYDNVPYDTAETGKAFYENGASALSEDGYMFFKVNEVGVVEEVVIPNDVLSKLTQ